MNENKRIKSALISVYSKDNLEFVIRKLHELEITIYSTGGTAKYILELGIPVISVETITNYPSILGGRVKTLHPKIFGGILSRRENENDIEDLRKYEIPDIDLVIVDLYPFEKTVESKASEEEIIEKIDIGGISLIRAAAKNYKDVVTISSQNQYSKLFEILENQFGETSTLQRKYFASEAFKVSSKYDNAILNFLSEENQGFNYSCSDLKVLRYGENPHQKANFFGNFNELFLQLNGKEISYNNLLDIDAAVNLISEFEKPAFAIIKHTNACGVSERNTILEAWKMAYQGDPISAFGGVLIANRKIDKVTAEEINTIFFEVIIAPNFDNEAIEILKEKKNRIILQQKDINITKKQFRSVLNGVLVQERDTTLTENSKLTHVTNLKPDATTIEELIFANKIVKHIKSNAIVLTKNYQLCASGVGQTSRVDALKQAIDKAQNFGFDLNGAVLASDAFFPFADSVEIAHSAGIKAVIQPGGSIKDIDSIEYCNNNNMIMTFTGIRHFKH